MKVAFRADASTTIGTGHLMRCLTLADALTRRGAECHFICRQDPGHLLELVAAQGHQVHALPAASGAADREWPADAAQTGRLLRDLRPDWLIVDHYRLDWEWERQIGALAGALLAIDDLGRRHRCQLLLDQNFGNPVHERYRESLDVGTELLLGPAFALLRPQFAALRPVALARREGVLTRVLVSMGGSDPGNETGKVLSALLDCGQGLKVDVVIGASNPHAQAIAVACRKLPNASLHVQTPRMAELMVAADCAIGAGGSTTWERCCLGLPALVTVLAENQAAGVKSVADVGGHILMGREADVDVADYVTALGALAAPRLRAMAAASAGICDGLGAERVVERLC